MGEGSVEVTDLLTRTAWSVRGESATLLDRSRSECGVSTVQYAFLMALIALAVALIVGLLGPGIKGLFGTGHVWPHGLTATWRFTQLTKVTVA
jgi:Flp pilus assembly pilin Flp